MTRVLIIGGDSLIGRSLASDLAGRGWDVTCTTRRRPNVDGSTMSLDLATADPDSTPLPRADIAIFAAAMARFADCRTSPDLARLVNVEVPVALARRLAEQGTRSILLSSAAVFDGASPYVAADAPTSPTTLYGAFKVEAEAGFRELGEMGGVVRLTKVLSGTHALISGWVTALRRHETVAAFDDLRVSPISLRDVTAAVEAAATYGGIVQASGAAQISYRDALAHLAVRLGRPLALVRSASAADSGIPEPERPLHTTLDSTTLSTRTGWAAPDPYELLPRLFIGGRAP